jgi:hypothetical protein
LTTLKDGAFLAHTNENFEFILDAGLAFGKGRKKRDDLIVKLDIARRQLLEKQHVKMTYRECLISLAEAGLQEVIKENTDRWDMEVKELCAEIEKLRQVIAECRASLKI